MTTVQGWIGADRIAAAASRAQTPAQIDQQQKGYDPGFGFSEPAVSTQLPSCAPR